RSEHPGSRGERGNWGGGLGRGSFGNEGSTFGDNLGRQHGLLGLGGQRKNRGPKGYTRSDERIREDLSDRLMDDDYIDSSEVEIVVSQGVVTLTGTVEERRMKHAIEDIADSIRGVSDVVNNIRV